MQKARNITFLDSVHFCSFSPQSHLRKRNIHSSGDPWSVTDHRQKLSPGTRGSFSRRGKRQPLQPAVSWPHAESQDLLGSCGSFCTPNLIQKSNRTRSPWTPSDESVPLTDGARRPVPETSARIYLWWSLWGLTKLSRLKGWGGADTSSRGGARGGETIGEKEIHLCNNRIVEKCMRIYVLNSS